MSGFKQGSSLSRFVSQKVSVAAPGDWVELGGRGQSLQPPRWLGLVLQCVRMEGC